MSRALDFLRSKPLGEHALRWSLVLIFLLFGTAKFAAYEAHGVAGLASHYPLFAWLYPLVGERGASAVIGALELSTAAALALGVRWPRLALVGAAMGCCTFLVTLSFLLGAPHVWQPGYGAPFLGSTGQFLLKDAGLLGGCVALLGAALRRIAGRAA